MTLIHSGYAKGIHYSDKSCSSSFWVERCHPGYSLPVGQCLTQTWTHFVTVMPIFPLVLSDFYFSLVFNAINFLVIFPWGMGNRACVLLPRSHWLFYVILSWYSPSTFMKSFLNHSFCGSVCISWFHSREVVTFWSLRSYISLFLES